MKYYATINKRVRYIRVYNVLRRVNQNTNVVSEFIQKFVDKYLLKRKRLDET